MYNFKVGRVSSRFPMIEKVGENVLDLYYNLIGHQLYQEKGDRDAISLFPSLKGLVVSL